MTPLQRIATKKSVARQREKEREEEREEAEAEATARFRKSVSDYITAQVPRYRTARAIDKQQVELAVSASGISEGTLRQYKSERRESLPLAETLRRLCLVARPEDPGSLAAEILFGTPRPAVSLSEQLGAYCDEQLRDDARMGYGLPPGRVRGDRTLAYIVERLREASDLYLLLGPVLAQLEMAEHGSDELSERSAAAFEAYDRLTNTTEVGRTWALIDRRAQPAATAGAPN